MTLSAQLSSPAALYRKLEREAYRAYHAPTALQKADHFFNFCVTASSMRDYCLEHQGMLTWAQRKPYDSAWWSVPLLVAAIEIGNSAKHFVLRDLNTGAPKTVQTRTARMKKAKFVDIYADQSGSIKAVPVERTEVTVTLSDGQRLELFLFTRGLLDYWKSYLKSIGINVRKQSHAQLARSAA